jgi:hypothetical protein
MMAIHFRLFASLVIAGLSIASPQTRTASNPPVKSIVGTVERVDNAAIYVKTGVQLVSLTIDDNTEVWKGKYVHGLSSVETGDDITARYRTEASGKLVANALWLNAVNFSGVITKTAEGKFEVFTNPNADPQSAYKKEIRIVEFDGDTTFESSAKEDLRPGREVQVVGVHLENGNVRAARITVYEGKRPVRMGNGKIVLPNGQLR